MEMCKLQVSCYGWRDFEELFVDGFTEDLWIRLLRMTRLTFNELWFCSAVPRAATSNQKVHLIWKECFDFSLAEFVHLNMLKKQSSPSAKTFLDKI